MGEGRLPAEASAQAGDEGGISSPFPIPHLDGPRSAFILQSVVKISASRFRVLSIALSGFMSFGFP